MAFQFGVLDKSFSRDTFDCESPALNDYLKTKARQSQDKGFNKTFVLYDDDDKTKKILGYYSISMAEVTLDSMPESLRKGLPRHPVPVAKIGRLAVDKTTKGRGFGKYLLVDALKRVKRLAADIGVYALVVDAKDESAKAFYLKFGFIAFEFDTMTLLLPVHSIP